MDELRLRQLTEEEMVKLVEARCDERLYGKGNDRIDVAQGYMVLYRQDIQRFRDAPFTDGKYIYYVTRSKRLK